LVLLYD